MEATASTVDRAGAVDRLTDNFDHQDPETSFEVLSEVYARLRGGCPVATTSAQGGYHLITRYADLVAVEKDTETFSSASGVLHPSHPDHPRSIPIEFDPPQHTAYRKLFMDAVSVPRVRATEPYLRDLASRLLDSYVEGEDFMQKVAVQLPIRAVGSLLGLGEDVNERFQEFGDTILQHFGTPKMIEAMGKLAEFTGEQIQERRANPREDYLTTLMHAQVDGRPLTDDEIINTVRSFVFAGFETTARSIANLVHHLAVHQDVQADLRANPDGIGNIIEENLRMYPPVQTMFRTVTKPVTLHGVDMQPGDKVVLLYSPANRDADHFEDPDTFCPARGNARQHVAFGWGPHLCVGAPLARAENRAILAALLDRPPFELAGEATHLPRLMMGQMMGVNILPIRFSKEGN